MRMADPGTENRTQDSRIWIRSANHYTATLVHNSVNATFYIRFEILCDIGITLITDQQAEETKNGVVGIVGKQ